jgi:uncharacterized membrane protein YeiB
MTPERMRPAAISPEATAPGRFDVFDLARGLAIFGMLGSHLVGTEGGTTALERGVTTVLATIEPTVGALFCVLAGVSWSIQAERVGVTPRFRRYFAGRALALGIFGVVFHVLFWKTEILVPFALMMALSLFVLGAGPRATALALLLFVAVTPLVEYLVAPYTARDWLENGLHAADVTVGWVTLRYLLVDGNYPLVSWMAFPLMGMLFWQTVRSRRQSLAWCLGSLGVAALAYAYAASTAPVGGGEPVRSWIARGWTPTSAVFLLTAGSGALVVVGALRLLWGTTAVPRVVQPVVLFGRASLSHYVAHIAIPYSLLRLWHPAEDWLPDTGLWALLAYLVTGIPLTVFWFRHHTHGPLEELLARGSRRPSPLAADGEGGQSSSVQVVRGSGYASLHTLRSFVPGEVVFPLEGRLVRQPTRFTIQVGADAHLDPISERTSPWGFLNHGCDPNVAIDIRRRAIVARRPIATGDELRFDYNSTEWELAEPFVCNCGSPRCVGVAMGFGHLSPARQKVMLGVAAPHIRTLHAAWLRNCEATSSREIFSRAPHGTSKINVETL